MRTHSLLRCSLLTDTYRFCSGWLQDTFIDPDGAETALADDRQAFIERDRARQLTPRDIWRLVEPRKEVAQVTGFAQLFQYLDQDRGADELRQLVVDHFNTTTYLRDHLHPHLSKYHLFYLTIKRIIKAISTCRRPWRPCTRLERASS